jgi:hypothetical protein
MFKKKPIQCPAGEWTTLISNFGSGYPKTFVVHLENADGKAIQGEYEEKRALWVFPQPAEKGQLVPQMRFHRKWINAIYKVRIRPTVALTAHVRN